MPKMDGLELINRIVKYFPTDVIVMTGQIDQYSYDQFVGAGASDFVQKPFTADEKVTIQIFSKNFSTIWMNTTNHF